MLTVKQLKEQLNNYPDETFVFSEDGEYGILEGDFRTKGVLEHSEACKIKDYWLVSSIQDVSDTENKVKVGDIIIII